MTIDSKSYEYLASNISNIRVDPFSTSTALFYNFHEQSVFLWSYQRIQIRSPTVPDKFLKRKALLDAGFLRDLYFCLYFSRCVTLIAVYPPLIKSFMECLSCCTHSFHGSLDMSPVQCVGEVNNTDHNAAKKKEHIPKQSTSVCPAAVISRLCHYDHIMILLTRRLPVQ